MATDYKTLRVPAEQYEAAKAQKEANNRTWGQQIVRPDGDRDEYDIPEGLEFAANATAEEIEELKAMIESLPKDTADELEGRLR